MLPGAQVAESLDERRRVDPGSHRVAVEEEGILVAMLAQAGRSGQERRVAETLGIVAQNRRDPVIGGAVTVPVPPLKKPRKCVELTPGCGRLELDSGGAGGGEVRRPGEGVAAINQDQGRPAQGQAQPIGAVLAHLVAINGREVVVLKGVGRRLLGILGAGRLLGAGGVFPGLWRQNRLVGDDVQHIRVNQLSHLLPREDQEIDVGQVFQRANRLFSDRDLAAA